MSRGNWLNVFALAGCVVALSACTQLSWPAPEDFGHHVQDQRYGERCGEAQQDQDGDICQQWRMAVAAESMRDIALVQSGILILALGFSVWAAFASHRQAVASEQTLASIDGAHLLVEFEDTGLRDLGYGPDIMRATKWFLRNYGETVAFIRWRHAQLLILPKGSTIEPFDWRGHFGGAMPHGVIAAPNDVSISFEAEVPSGISLGDKPHTLEKGETCYLQGFVAFTDNGPNVHIYVFTYIYEDGLFRIYHTGRFEENDKYNAYYRRYRPNRWRLLRSSMARRLRKVAQWVEPKPKK